MLRRFKISDRIYKIAKVVSNVFTHDIISHTPNGPLCLDVDVVILTFVLSLHLPSNKIDAIAWAKINALNIAYIENFK